MKTACYLLNTVVLMAILFFSSCEKEDGVDPNQPIITLSSDKFTGKSGQELTVTVNVAAPNGISALLITKGVNLKGDGTFGNNGVLRVTPSSSAQKTLVYEFKYVLSPDEVDKLVGFNFRVEDAQGLASEKDFTLNTTVSGAQLLYSYRWNLKAKMWETPQPPVSDLKDCETDDSYMFNRDSTMAIGYGTKPCTFDGFNVYEKWTLSPDEKILTIRYSSLFDPSKVTTDTFHVRSLTKERLIIDITYDLTVFGLSDKEVFVYTYEASPR